MPRHHPPQSHAQCSLSSTGMREVKNAKHFTNSVNTICPSLFLSKREKTRSKKKPSFIPTKDRNSLRITMAWIAPLLVNYAIINPRATNALECVVQRVDLLLCNYAMTNSSYCTFRHFLELLQLFRSQIKPGLLVSHVRARSAQQENHQRKECPCSREDGPTNST